MGKRKFFYSNIKTIRTALSEAMELADLIHADERRLIEKLYVIDQRRFFVYFGHKSLSGFCRVSLRLTKTQTQRIVTQVRRLDPMAKIRDELLREAVASESAPPPTSHGWPWTRRK